MPAQASFVVPLGIRSVIGFGGLLPSRELFTLIVFSKAPISKEVAGLFKSLALTVRGLALRFDQTTMFAARIRLP